VAVEATKPEAEAPKEKEEAVDAPKAEDKQEEKK
jgi:hypothetical protein